MQIHVHVYKIAGKAEVNITTENEVEAKEKALAMVKQGSLKSGESDCNYIAMVMGAQGEGLPGDVANSSVVTALKYLLRQQLIKIGYELDNHETSREHNDVKRMLEELEK